MSTKLEKSIKKNIDSIAREEAKSQNSLLSQQAAISKNKADLEAFFLMGDKEEDSMNFAMELLSEIGFQLFDNDSITLMDEFKKRLTEKQIDEDDKICLKDFFGIKKEKLEGIYELGLIMLEGELYFQARDLFLLIIQLDPYFTNSWMGLGVALQSLKQYENAIRIFSYLILFDKNPEIFIQAIQCCIDGNQLFDAKKLMSQLEKLECTNAQLKQIKELKTKLS